MSHHQRVVPAIAAIPAMLWQGLSGHRYRRESILSAYSPLSREIRTRKQISFGRLVNGSFFSNGSTYCRTKLSCWLVHRFSRSAKTRVRSACVLFLKYCRTFARKKSSWSPASLQSGCGWSGPGLAAGVGGGGGSWLEWVGESGSAAIPPLLI